MTHFPSTPRFRPAAPTPGLKTPALRDVLWGRPIFKAPQLTNPRAALDPLPFTATRITQRSTAGAAL